MAEFPSSIPTSDDKVSTDTLSAAGHTAHHNKLEDEIIALATKLGTGSSTPTANTLARGTGAGTSDWGQLTEDYIAAADKTGTGKFLLENEATATNLTVSSGALVAAYPVGSIYMNATSSSNPNTLLGFGTWTAFGAGRVLVGLNSGDTDFDTAEETGGAKTHTLTASEMPSHTHSISYGGSDATGTSGVTLYRHDAGSNLSRTTTSAGSGGAHNNLQPYIVVYMWKRTA